MVFDKLTDDMPLISIYDENYVGAMSVTSDENLKSISELIDLLGDVRDERVNTPQQSRAPLPEEPSRQSREKPPDEPKGDKSIDASKALRPVREPSSISTGVLDTRQRAKTPGSGRQPDARFDSAEVGDRTQERDALPKPKTEDPGTERAHGDVHGDGRSGVRSSDNTEDDSDAATRVGVGVTDDQRDITGLPPGRYTTDTTD